jgi:DNA-binding response OmpR family regulator
MTMEQAVIFATGRRVSSSRAFQLKPPDAELDTMPIGEIELNPARRTVKKSGYRVHLTPTEFELVQQLMAKLVDQLGIRDYWLRSGDPDTA